MADSPVIPPWLPDFSNLFTEPCNQDPISTTDAAPFTFDLSELEAQFDDDPEAFSQWCQFPGDQMDFSPQLTTQHRKDQLQVLNQQPHDKNVSSCHIRQHETRAILPSCGTKSADSVSPNQYALLLDKPRNGYGCVLDGAQKTQYPARTASLPEDSAPHTSRTPPSIESETLKQHNMEQVVILKKRHLDTEYGKPNPPRLVHDKRQKTAADNCSKHDQVGTVEASFIEYWLSKFPDVYPGLEQFGLLAGLTQLRTETVQSWFNKRLRNETPFIESANLPMKPSAATEAPNPGIPQMTLIQQPSDQPVQQPLDRTLEEMKIEASSWVREHKAKKCRKKRNSNNFFRDPEKPYCCTMGCRAKFKDKDDWRKHEERNYPQGGWICDVGSIVHFDGRTVCAFCEISNPTTEHDHGKALCSKKKVKARGRLHFRKQHFSQHFSRVHPGIPYDRYLENNHFTVNSKFPPRCGFCRYLFKHWRDRIEHIGGHFIAGKDMTQWDFGVEDDEVDQAKSADHENPDGDGGFSGKRHRTPDDGSDSSDNDSNDFPSKSAPKQRRRNTQHTYARQTCSFIQSRDSNCVRDFGGTTHLHQESHSVALNDSFPVLKFSNLEPENISYTPSSIIASIKHSAPNRKLMRPFIANAVIKRTRPMLSEACKLFNTRLEAKAIERLRRYRVPHYLRTCENSAYSPLRTILSTWDDLASLLQSYAGTLVPSAEAIARCCTLLASGAIVFRIDVELKDVPRFPGNVNSDMRTVISMTKYAPELSKNLSARWSADISSLASLLLDMWRLLINIDKVPFKTPLKELFLSSALHYENFSRFPEWITLLRKNGHVMRTRVTRKVDTFDKMLTVQQKDTHIISGFPSHLNSDIHLQSPEKLFVPEIENQQNTSPISIDTASKVYTAICRDIQSASGGEDISEAPRHHTPMSQDDSSMPAIKPIMPDAGYAPAVFGRVTLPDKNFYEEVTEYSPSSLSNDLSSLYAVEARAPSTGVQSEFCYSGIDSSLDLSRSTLRNSHLETNFDFVTLGSTKSSHQASVVDYNIQHEPLAGLPLTETWLESTVPYDITFATPTTTLDPTSPIFPEVAGYGLSSASGIQRSWFLNVDDLESIIPPFPSPDLTSDSMKRPDTSVSFNTHMSSKSWNHSSHNQGRGRRVGPLSSENRNWGLSSHNQTRGRRAGPLSLEYRMNAALVRKIGACWRCRFHKVGCDTGTTCTPCERLSKSPFKGAVCFRGRLRDYVKFFLPNTITSRYSETAIKVAIHCQIREFTNNVIEVSITTGPCHPPILISVCEYLPPSRESLQLHHTSLSEFDDMPVQNTYLHTLHLALLHYDPAELREKLSRHVKALIEIPLDINETMSGETWIVSYKMFEAVNKYRRVSNIHKKDRILELAFELHTMYYIIGCPIIIEPSSASQAFAKLRRPLVFPYNEKILSSNIINLQLKCEMIALLRETTAQVLHGLECILVGTRDKHTTWPIAVCTVSLICLCIEAVQIATDATTILKMLEAEMITVDTLRAKHCQELEQVVFKHIMLIFKHAYKSRRAQKNGFNPIRDGLEVNEERGITLPLVELVQDMRRIIREHREDIVDRAKDIEFEAEPAKLLEDHRRLRKQLSGRLLSKFLKEFG